MTPTIRRLLIRTLIGLPLCYLFWYFTAEQQARWIGTLLNGVVNATFPVPVPVIRQGAVLELTLKLPASLVQPGREGSFIGTITLDTLIYSCGLPLFVALMLATPGSLRRLHLLLLGVGMMLLYELLALYVAAGYNTLDLLHRIGADEARWLFGIPWSDHFYLLTRTTFSLVLPSALAIFLWAGFNAGRIGGSTDPAESAPSNS